MLIDSLSVINLSPILSIVVVVNHLSIHHYPLASHSYKSSLVNEVNLFRRLRSAWLLVFAFRAISFNALVILQQEDDM